MPRALLSVSDKSGLIAFASALAARRYELVSTGGTARALADAGLPVIAVSDVTGFPEILDGRVKTLHPRIHGGILARRSRADDLEALAEHGIGLVDIVVVNLYPFAAAAAKRDLPFDDLVEEIDIGGPSLVRAAAKNFRDVLVVVSPDDYQAVVAALDAPGGPSPAFRFDLARRAFAHTAQYDATIASTLAGVTAGEGGFERAPAAAFALQLVTSWTKVRDLRYGENPHQPAAWYRSEPSSGLGAAHVLQGKELSYTNLLDLDAAARIALEFDEPAAVVIKHTNPCGVATGTDAADAYVRARDADALSAFGGIVGLNRPIDEASARAIVSTFIEAVVAPGVGAGARAVLATKANMRVVVADLAAAASGGVELRSILGGLLAQARDRVAEATVEWGDEGAGAFRVVTKRQPTPDEWRALRFAWRVCAHVKSNTVIFTGPDRTLAIGAGQMSRVDAVKVAVMKANASLQGAVAASDAFFPFRDGLDAVATAGATAVVQPGGSVRDHEVIAAADEHGLAMVFTGKRHFRH
ncbi:MAG: bifunctional phosphoribosylaminoimidazolecarboxamide formyltransferase/IMP cyclohydrolase [Acidobacteria bacterium]|nr:bifunctional phosphoribosylaminoimidazolecarboxamide formyltransferase/IMP cyclohydrolase [Acidobacteriota bacterium]